jgi:YgiT-type zinc finger domain-containing protein
MRSATVKTVMWYGERMVLVENVPAMVCDSCVEQFYDDETTDALRRLTEEGFPFAEQTGEVRVPVYSLKKRPQPTEES